MMPPCASRVKWIALVLVVLFGCGALYDRFMGHLPWERLPERDFTVEELLIDESAFPDGWEPSGYGPRRPANAPLDHYNSVERIQLHFYGGGTTVQQIHRFATVRGARREFDRRMRIGLGFAAESSPPAALQYVSSTADQFYLACSHERDGTLCVAIGQYEEYCSMFSTHLDPAMMTIADLKQVLRAIDQRMASHLDEDEW